MFRDLQMVLVGFLAVLFGLSYLARRFPDVTWLQAFHFKFPQLSPEQQARQRQRANIYAGVELILLGIVIPPGYFVLKVMLFTSPTPIEVTVVAAISILCIVLGVTAIWRNRRRRHPGE